MDWWDGVFRTERGLVCVRHRVLFEPSPHTYTFHPGYRCPVCTGLTMAEIKEMWDAELRAESQGRRIQARQDGKDEA